MVKPEIPLALDGGMNGVFRSIKIIFTKAVSIVANKAYKFRLYPTKEQEIMFIKTFGCVRFIYNKMLADKIEFYKETKQKLNNTPAQ